MGESLILDLLVTFDIEVVVGNGTCVVLNLIVLSRVASGTGASISASGCGLDSACNEELALLASELLRHVCTVRILGLCLLRLCLDLRPISVHSCFNFFLFLLLLG